MPAQTAPLLPTPRGGFVAAAPRGGLRRLSVDAKDNTVTIRASIGSAANAYTFHKIKAALRGAVAKKKRQMCVHGKARTKLTWMFVRPGGGRHDGHPSDSRRQTPPRRRRRRGDSRKL